MPTVEAQHLVATWKIDPTYVPAVTEFGAMCNRSPQELVQEWMDKQCDDGYFFQYFPEPFKVRFTDEQRRGLEKELGVKELTGKAIYDFVMSFATLSTGKHADLRERV